MQTKAVLATVVSGLALYLAADGRLTSRVQAQEKAEAPALDRTVLVEPVEVACPTISTRWCSRRSEARPAADAGALAAEP